jgi:hypothetical protein
MRIRCSAKTPSTTPSSTRPGTPTGSKDDRRRPPRPARHLGTEPQGPRGAPTSALIHTNEAGYSCCPLCAKVANHHTRLGGASAPSSGPPGREDRVARLPEPVLAFTFPGGGSVSMEFTEDALDGKQARRGAWLELLGIESGRTKVRVCIDELLLRSADPRGEIVDRQRRQRGMQVRVPLGVAATASLPALDLFAAGLGDE